MEIKVRIPTLFPKYKIIKIDNKYIVLAKKFGWCGVAVSEGSSRCENWREEYWLKYCANDTFEDAMKLVERIKTTVVWSGR